MKGAYYVGVIKEETKQYILLCIVMTNRNYDGEDFGNDIAIAAQAEHILFDCVDAELGLNYDVQLKTDDAAWYKRGDVAILDYNGKDIGIDAKDDGVCYRTGNIFVEEYIDWRYYYTDGWIKAQYDVLAVVSQEDCKIYFIDFPRLQKEYKQLRFRANVPSYFDAHTCWGSLVKIDRLRSEGLLLAEVRYTGDEQKGYHIA